MQFRELTLPDCLMDGISKTGFTTLTPIQEQSLPFALQGRDIGGQAHHQRAGDGDDHADPVQAILEIQVADQRGDQRTTEVAGVIDGCQPSAFGQAEAGLLLHQRQQWRVGKAGNAEGEQQAENAGPHHLEALDLFSLGRECHCCRS